MNRKSRLLFIKSLWLATLSLHPQEVAESEMNFILLQAASLQPPHSHTCSSISPSLHSLTKSVSRNHYALSTEMSAGITKVKNA